MMFIDAQCDAVLIRDVFGPQVYCRTCFHMTYAVDGNRCAWCKSTNIGGQPCTVKHGPHMGPMQEDEREPTKHRRLAEGFALLKAAEYGGE